LENFLACLKEMIWSISNSSGNHVVLESDVKKFRRNQGKNNNSDVPATVQEEKYSNRIYY